MQLTEKFSDISFMNINILNVLLGIIIDRRYYEN